MTAELTALIARLKNSKTFYLCMLVLVTSVGSMISGHVTVVHALSMAVVSLLGIFLRDSIAKLEPAKPEPAKPDTTAQAVFQSDVLTKMVEGGTTVIEDFISGKLDRAEAEKKALEVLLGVAGAATPEEKKP